MQFAGGPAAHIRVFQPQWAYWATSPGASLRHAQRRQRNGASFFVGRTESFDESLALLAHWLGVPLAQLRYSSRKREYGARPRLHGNWTQHDREALRSAVERSGESTWHDGMLSLYALQAAGYPGSAAALQAAVRELATLNAEPASAAEQAVERAWRRRKKRTESM